MSEDDEYTDDAQQAPEGDNEVIRTLRAQANEGKAARAEADAAIRELAFAKAGIDTDDPRQGYFVRGYQGDVSAEAIKAAATEAGFLGTQQTQMDQGMTDAERAAFAGSAQAAAGSTPVPQAPADPFADLRSIDPRRSGVLPEQFGMMIAERVERAGGEVAYEGPQATVFEPRTGTPNPSRR